MDTGLDRLLDLPECSPLVVGDHEEEVRLLLGGLFLQLLIARVGYVLPRVLELLLRLVPLLLE
jgi:hypothetical protein